MKPSLDRTTFGVAANRVFLGIPGDREPLIPEPVISAAHWGIYTSDFNAHFKINGTSNLSGLPRYIHWDALEALVNHKPVHAIKFHYGYVPGSFVIPVELLTYDETARELVPIPDELYIYDEAHRTFTSLSTVNRDNLVKAYYGSIKVIRNTGPSFEALRSSLVFAPHPDPCSCIYGWDRHVKALLEANMAFHNSDPSNRFYLGLSCLGVEDPFASEGYPSNEPWHHSLGMFAAVQREIEGAIAMVDLISTEGAGPMGIANRGMDYGNLCPPRCK